MRTRFSFAIISLSPQLFCFFISLSLAHARAAGLCQLVLLFFCCVAFLLVFA